MDHAASIPLPPLTLPAEEDGCPDEAPPLAPSDEDLLEQVAAGDTDSFTALYGRYERPVFGVLLRMAGRRALAEEWLQETFTRVWRAAATHDRSRGAVRSWIYAIALNTARRQMSRVSSRAPHVPLDHPAVGRRDDSAEGEAKVTERLDETRRREAVAGALAELPDYMREVVVLRCSRELSFAEIAEVTGAPEGTLKSRFHRAVAALRERLDPDGRPREWRKEDGRRP